MKRKTLISIPLVLAIIISLFGGLATGASATTVTDMSEFIVQSATPTSLGRWDGSGYTYTVTDGANSSRTIAYSGTSTSSHVSLSIPQSALNENASAKPYILHLSYRIQNDRTNPAYITHRMQYKSSSGSGLYNDLFVANTSQFTMNLDTTKNITSFGTSNYNYLDAYDYKVDLYENLKTGAYQIYLNGVKWISSYDYTSGAYTTLFSASGNGAYTINEYRIRVTGAANSSWAFNLVNPCYEIYSEDVMMDEVVAYSLSGMSNYLNETASEQVKPGIDGGDATKTGVSGTESTLGGYTSYTISGASGKNLRWWSGTQNTNGVHLPFVSNFATADKAWLHMGFNITGTASLNFKFQYWKSGGSTATTGETGLFSGTDYREDLYFDLSTNIIYMYQNNTYTGTASIGFSGDAKQIKNIYMNKKDANSFTMSNLVIEYYADGVTPSDMLIGYDERTKTTYDYVYQIDGIKSGTNVIGSTDGLCSVTGDNTNGYTIRPASVNATNGGFARFYLGYTADTGIFQRDTDRVLHQTFYYKPAAVSTEQTIGMHGGTSSLQGYKYFLYANPSTGDFEDTDRNRIKSYDTNTFYKIDIIVNCCNFKYYFLLDGICIESGTLYFQPIWQIVYTSRSTSDYMVIKNMQTTLYKDNYTLLDKVKPLLERIYANLESCPVSDGTATVTTSYIANTTNSATANTKVIYGIYNSAGSLLKYQAVNNANTYVNGSNLTQSVTIPTDGTTLKVFMWNMNLGSGDLTPIANQITKSLQ